MFNIVVLFYFQILRKYVGPLNIPVFIIFLSSFISAEHILYYSAIAIYEALKWKALLSWNKMASFDAVVLGLISKIDQRQNKEMNQMKLLWTNFESIFHAVADDFP